MTYEQMAYYYDQLMEDAPYDDWVDFTGLTIQSFGKYIDSIADLGCGTGRITTRLSQLGYRMTGVDNSSAMLSVAEQHASQIDAPVQLIQQDLRELNGIEDQDMAISFCDVINYITEEEDIYKVFANVSNILKPGGLFVFDVHALSYVKQHLVNQTFAVVSDDISYIWFCQEGDEPGDMYHDLTFFVRDEEQYNRFDEWHHQKTFSIDIYNQALKQAGFDIQSVSADFSLQPNDHEDEAERVFITAVKRGWDIT